MNWTLWCCVVVMGVVNWRLWCCVVVVVALSVVGVVVIKTTCVESATCELGFSMFGLGGFALCASLVWWHFLPHQPPNVGELFMRRLQPKHRLKKKTFGVAA